jgi:hypothetical protein
MNYEKVLNTIKNRETKKIANNTYLVKHDDYFGLKLHETEVVKFFPSHVEYYTGGWKTVTTRDRLQYGPAHVFTEKGTWYVGNYNDKQSMFYEGIKVDYDGNVISKKVAAPLKQINSIKRQISKFVKLVDTIETLPLPEAGDCFYCSMYTTDKHEPLGDAMDDTSHLMEHIKEGYLHGSLLVNAMRAGGFRDEQIGFHFQADVRWQFKNKLQRYLTKKLIA